MRILAPLGLVALTASVDVRGVAHGLIQGRSALAGASSSSSSPGSSSVTVGHATTSTTGVTTTSSTKTSTLAKQSPSSISAFVPPSGSPFAMRLACSNNAGCEQNWPSQAFVFTEVNPYGFNDGTNLDPQLSTDLLHWAYNKNALSSRWVIDSKAQHLEPYNFNYSTYYTQGSGDRAHANGYFAHINPKASPSRLLFANETRAAEHGLQPVTWSHTSNQDPLWPTNTISCKTSGGVALKTLICDQDPKQNFWIDGIFLGNGTYKNCYEMSLVQVPIYEGQAYCGSACNADGVTC